MNTVSLSSLRPGMVCRLRKLELEGGLRRRLQDMGFVPGARIICAYAAPSGSTVAFVCSGTLMAMRTAECSDILVDIGA